MGRKRNIYIRDFFTIKDFSGNCKICKKKMSSVCLTNMKRHLQKDHSDIYDQKRAKIESTGTFENDKKIKFTIELSVNDVVNSCINLLTSQSVHLSHFDSEPFNVLTKPIFAGLNIPQINSRNIFQHVQENCNEIINKISNLTKNKIVCVKLDKATRHDRTILGINVQIITSNKLEIFTLGVLELKPEHTTQYLTLEITKFLKRFQIDKKQVYAITTGNGKNMVKVVHSDDEETDSASEEHYESIVKNVRFGNIISIKCAAQTLQLAVEDFLKNLNRNAVNKSRKSTKSLRPSIYREHLSSSEQLQAYDLKELDKILQTLQPVNTLTLILQKSNLLFGDFYKNWLELIFTLRSLNTEMSRQLLGHIEKRQTELLECDTMYAALFLDPRFRRMLSNEKVNLAKNHLKNIVIQLVNVQNTESQHFTTGTRLVKEELFEKDESSVTSSRYLLAEGLEPMEINYSSSDDYSMNDSVRQAFNEIKNYKEKNMDTSADLLEYWESKKFTLPRLRKLALIVHSVPTTQVSVERLFSALKLILGDLKYNLSEENLESLMMVKLNT